MLKYPLFPCSFGFKLFGWCKDNTFIEKSAESPPKNAKGFPGRSDCFVDSRTILTRIYECRKLFIVAFVEEIFIIFNNGVKVD